MVKLTNSTKPLYIFLDEGGNFDFSIKGTKYFTLTSLTTTRNWQEIYQKLDNARYELIEWGINQEYFHCCEDNSRVKNKVFGIIDEFNNIESDVFRVDTIVVEKRKTGTKLQDEKHFYAKILGMILKYIFKSVSSKNFSEIIVITDQLPLKRKKDAFEKAIKINLAEELKPIGIRYRIFHHSSKSHFGLQIADYCNWAVQRKWERGEKEYFDKIKPLIKKEFDVFKSGKTFYY